MFLCCFFSPYDYPFIETNNDVVTKTQSNRLYILIYGGTQFKLIEMAKDILCCKSNLFNIFDLTLKN